MLLMRGLSLNNIVVKEKKSYFKNIIIVKSYNYFFKL